MAIGVCGSLMSGLVADKTKVNIQNHLVLDFKEGKQIYCINKSL